MWNMRIMQLKAELRILPMIEVANCNNCQWQEDGGCSVRERTEEDCADAGVVLMKDGNIELSSEEMEFLNFIDSIRKQGVGVVQR